MELELSDEEGSASDGEGGRQKKRPSGAVSDLQQVSVPMVLYPLVCQGVFELHKWVGWSRFRGLGIFPGSTHLMMMMKRKMMKKMMVVVVVMMMMMTDDDEGDDDGGGGEGGHDDSRRIKSCAQADKKPASNGQPLLYLPEHKGLEKQEGARCCIQESKVEISALLVPRENRHCPREDS